MRTLVLLPGIGVIRGLLMMLVASEGFCVVRCAAAGGGSAACIELERASMACVGRKASNGAHSDAGRAGRLIGSSERGAAGHLPAAVCDGLALRGISLGSGHGSRLRVRLPKAC